MREPASDSGAGRGDAAGVGAVIYLRQYNVSGIMIGMGVAALFTVSTVFLWSLGLPTVGKPLQAQVPQEGSFCL